MNRSKEEALSKALKYNQKSVFATKEQSTYRWLLRNNLIDQACAHMTSPFRWEKNDAFKIAKKYKHRIDLVNKNPSCYKYLQSRGFLDEACKHMQHKEIRMLWNKTSAFKIAKRCKSVSFLRDYHRSCYNWLKQNNLLAEACKHLTLKTRWNKKLAFLEAKKHKQRSNLMRLSSGCYHWLVSNKLLEEACSHMEKLITIWDKKSAFKEAKRCKTRAQLMTESSGCYYWLLKHNLLEEAGSHFEVIQNLREKAACDIFLKKLKKYKFTVRREYLIYFQNKKCFIDFYIEIPDKGISFAVEYKHDASSWTQKHLNHQVDKYNKAFKASNSFQGTYLVSAKGKHGFSEDQFLFILDTLEKTGELLLPNSLRYLKDN